MNRFVRRLPRRLVSAPLLLSGALAWGACMDGAAGDAPTSPAIRFAGLGTCSASGNDDGQFPADSDRVVIELSGGALSESFRAQATAADATAAGQLIFQNVPVGTGLTLRAVACSGSTTRWAGRTQGVAVTEFGKSFPSVFLTPIGTMTCIGSGSSTTAARSLSEPRAFAALAARGDGAFALGGGKKLTIAGANITLDGTQTIDRYDATTGEVSAAGSLTSVRVGAIARTLSDGRIRVIGGATSIKIAAAGKPGVFAEGSASPASATEVFDPATGTSSVEVATPLAALPALGVVGSGAIVAAGGSRGAGFSDELVIITGATSSTGTVPGGARFGATVVPLGGDLALVWGGNVNGTVAEVAALVDTSKSAASAASALTVTGATDVSYGASGSLLAASGTTMQVLIVGGGAISTGGAFESPHLAAARLLIVTVDTSAKTATVTSAGVGDVDANRFKRAFGVLTALPDGDLAYLGGFTAFTSVADICGSGVDCLQSAIVRFTMDDVATAPVAASVGPTLAVNGGPLGTSLVQLGDGAWFVTGGVDSITNANLAKDPATFRYEDLDPDLCSAVAPASTP